MRTTIRHRAGGRVVAVVGAAAVAATVLLACQPPAPAAPMAVPVAARASTPAPAPLRVLVLGDSLTGEARAVASATGSFADHDVDWSGSIFGSAPCNGRATARSTTYRPDVVLIAYSGNGDGVVGNCMAAERGADLIARYRTDVTALVDRFRNGHTRVTVVGAPHRSAMEADSDELFTTLQVVARSSGAAFVDGGRDITPDRTDRRSLPCLPTESRCGTAGPGRNLVRNPDRIHLCPDAVELSGRCRSYSSGAVRYAAALADAIAAARAPT